ncbi:unnamed protein product, partial [Choristocarpus tenellus]
LNLLQFACLQDPIIRCMMNMGWWGVASVLSALGVGGGGLGLPQVLGFVGGGRQISRASPTSTSVLIEFYNRERSVALGGRRGIGMVRTEDEREEGSEIQLVGRVCPGEDADRFGDLTGVIMSKHGGRVAASSQVTPSASGLLCFRLVREGFIIDEYCPQGGTLFEEELCKRVDAALSLLHPTDKTTLKHLWTPPVNGQFKDEIAVAAYAVQLASTVARELQQSLVKGGAIRKSDSSPVTVADFSVQVIVLTILKRYFPDHGFIAEESSAVLRQDPLALSGVLGVARKALLWPSMSEEDVCAAIDLGSRGHRKKGKCVNNSVQGRGPLRGGGSRTWVL